MRLVDLNPQFLGAGGEGIYNSKEDVEKGIWAPRREGVGVEFDCPCGKCGRPCFVMFKNPLDGGREFPDHITWNRTGETFETLTLTPSILRNPSKGGCGWHGWITNGEVITC